MKYPIISPKNRTPRPPLRSFKELRDELGVARVTLSNLLREPGAPKPVFKCGNNVGIGSGNSWYKKAEFMSWWESRTADAPVQGVAA